MPPRVSIGRFILPSTLIHSPTRLVECRGVMTRDKKRVLQLDDNTYYGGEGATVDLSEIFMRVTGLEEAR